MAKVKKKAPRPWTAADMKQLRRMAGVKRSRVIAKQLRRSQGALRFKAHIEGISLRVR